jgi:phosphatidylglycerophosphate synthase
MTHSYEEIRKRCLKPDEQSKPLYARHVTHFFSTQLIFFLQNARLTPNLITLASLLIAFFSLPFFAAMTPVGVLIGALMIEVYYILDAMDGQWARLKDQKSLTGAFFDYLINYAFHAPLLFAISWGVFQDTGNALFLILGFVAGFGCLWVVLIWNLRASVLLPRILAVKSGRAEKPAVSILDAGPVQTSLPKEIFSWLHKLLIFPWFMHVLSIVSILCFIFDGLFGRESFTSAAFGFFLIYYGITGPLVSIILTTQWVLSRRLDRAPELQP